MFTWRVLKTSKYFPTTLLMLLQWHILPLAHSATIPLPSIPWAQSTIYIIEADRGHECNLSTADYAVGVLSHVPSRVAYILAIMKLVNFLSYAMFFHVSLCSDIVPSTWNMSLLHLNLAKPLSSATRLRLSGLQVRMRCFSMCSYGPQGITFLFGM